jgi:hypothetical protein
MVRPRRRVQLNKLDTHIAAQLGIKVRQRFVEKEYTLRITHQRPTERNALLLATGKLARFAVRVVRSTEAAAAVSGHLLIFARSAPTPRLLQRVGNVLGHTLMCG